MTVKVQPGDRLEGGMIYAICPETSIIEHRCLVRPGLSGVVESVAPDGKYKVNDTVVTLKDDSGHTHESVMSDFPGIRDILRDTLNAVQEQKSQCRGTSAGIPVL